MKKLLLGVLLVFVLLPVSAGAIDVNMIAISTGTIDSKASYFAFGGNASPDSPAYENRYQSIYYSNGGQSGLLMQNSFAGSMEVKEQFEVQSGYGRFETKAGTDFLVNVPREDAPGIVDGTRIQNAAGFGGLLMPGIVTSTFATDKGLIATSNAEGVGVFRAGAIQKVETGSNDGAGPIVVESQEVHVKIDGQFKVQAEFIFPK